MTSYCTEPTCDRKHECLHHKATIRPDEWAVDFSGRYGRGNPHRFTPETGCTMFTPKDNT